MTKENINKSSAVF